MLSGANYTASDTLSDNRGVDCPGFTETRQHLYGQWCERLLLNLHLFAIRLGTKWFIRFGQLTYCWHISSSLVSSKTLKTWRILAAVSSFFDFRPWSSLENKAYLLYSSSFSTHVNFRNLRTAACGANAAWKKGEGLKNNSLNEHKQQPPVEKDVKSNGTVSPKEKDEHPKMNFSQTSLSIAPSFIKQWIWKKTWKNLAVPCRHAWRHPSHSAVKGSIRPEIRPRINSCGSISDRFPIRSVVHNYDDI